jgi:hypothetical protein
VEFAVIYVFYVGDYEKISQYGFNASLWGIIFGILVRLATDFTINKKDSFNGEYFIKVGRFTRRCTS